MAGADKRCPDGPGIREGVPALCPNPLNPRTFLLLAFAPLAAAAVLALAGCNSTSVDDTWTAPDLTQMRFGKIMVVATFPDGAMRRAAEDAMQSELVRAEGVTSYSLLGAESDLKDLAKVSAVLKAAGVDGVVVMRPVSDRSEIIYIPGTMYPRPYRTFRGYYSRDYALRPFFAEPGRYATERVVQLETNIYEVAGERLVWSGATTSTNPGNLRQLIKDAAAAIRAKLTEEKLVAAP